LFFRETEQDTPQFMGDGCLNNDKGNTKTFGLETDGDSGNDTKKQKWEFRNNTELICTFESDRFYDEENKNLVVLALESTYPDEGDLEDKGLTPNYDYL
jgi:hypothetical protein